MSSLYSQVPSNRLYHGKSIAMKRPARSGIPSYTALCQGVTAQDGCRQYKHSDIQWISAYDTASEQRRRPSSLRKRRGHLGLYAMFGRVTQRDYSYAASNSGVRTAQARGSRFGTAKTRYDLGLTSIVELSWAELHKTEAAIGNVNARTQYKFEIAMISFQTGVQP